MAPPVTTNDPAASIIVPQASATQDPGVKKTAAVWKSIPLLPPFGHAHLPKETNTIVEPKPQAPKPTNQVPIIEPQTPPLKPVDDDSAAKHQDSSHPGSGSTDPGEQSNFQSSNIGDPEIPGNLNGLPNVQGSRGDSTLLGDPHQGGSKDPASPVQNQITDPGNSERTKDVYLAKTTMSLASHAVVAGPSGVRVDDVEVMPNQAPASVSGVAVINQGNSIVVASQIFHLPVPTEPPTTTIAGQAIVPIANGVLIQGIPVTGTSPVVISGTTFSVDDSRLYLGSKSYKLPTANAAAVTLVNGVVALPMSNAVSIYGTTLTAGAPAATFSGTTVSLDSASNLIFDGTAQALPSFPQTLSELGQVTTVNSMAVKLLPSGVSVAGTTLTPGAPAITTSGTSVSLGSTALAVGTSSVLVSFRNPPSFVTTIGGETITAVATAVKIGSVTLSPGGQGTALGGTLVSLGSGGSLVVGSRTVILGAPTSSLGALIIAGFGPAGISANSSSPSGGEPTRVSNNTQFGVQGFEGKAREHLRSLTSKGLAALTIAIHLTLYLHI